ncbi:type VI secretion system tip protein VgrG [Pseudomonas gingeri]|uniref:type VI secretion system Vgr family protein n=1 Tax=Pseudomonas gingeri TaxID=117681 RepID=UPI0015A4649C|nr:type VI secretion system tip protein VgrG [Pseudomonas gingeri]NWD74218.1 type VI secretion system tip protein VgrG [Pseudomonas gingeri]
MFSAANQQRFKLTLNGFEHDLRVLGFKGSESLNQPYRIDIELVSESADLDLESLLHQPVFLSLGAENMGLHGHVHSAGQGESTRRLTRYQLTLVPRLAYLEHTTQQRIFQHQTVPDIIAQVLKEHGILADAFQFQQGPKPHAEREYCTQYDETDLNFIQRLCEEEGLSFHFRHSPDQHLLVFGIHSSIFPRLESTPYKRASGLVAQGPVIKAFGVRVQTRPTRTTLRHYDFEQPHVQLQADCRPGSLPGADLEHYVYPGEFRDERQGKKLAERDLQRHRSDYRLARGESDQPSLRSGHCLLLSEHPRQDWNSHWLLTEVNHEGYQPQVLEEYAGPEVPWQGYRNTFSAIPDEVEYQPPHRHQKPFIRGSQSAWVTGPAGQEIHCDAHGRVKVQFPWDREDRNDEHSSCWLRVASSWAGARYGSVVVPRVGMEVVVAFFEGDPDRPYVSACLHHKNNEVPYPLPESQTQSVFKTRSTPGGEGYNELRIEDRSGAEQIALRAQRDFTVHALNDQRLQVDRQRSVQVGGDSRHELQGEEQHITHGQRLTELRQDDHLTVNGEQHIQTASHLLRATRDIHLSAGDNVVIDAGSSLTIRAGGQWLTLNPAGIFSSTEVTLEGHPVAVTQAAPLSPGSQPLVPEEPDPILAQQLGDPARAIVELCQKPQGGTPQTCPRKDCPCRAAQKELSR